MRPEDVISDSTVNRRGFLAAAGTLATITIVPRHVLGGPGYQAPSDMIHVAGIGFGSRGAQNLQGVADPDVPIMRPQRMRTGQPLTPEQKAEAEKRRAARLNRPAQSRQGSSRQNVRRNQSKGESKKLAHIYALCDVDTEYAAHVFKGYPKAKVYQDFRKMLDQEKEIDAVMIGTPDHTHAVIAAYAMKMGKHVYVEKPLCKTVFEARKLTKLAKETGVVTQMGNQGHAAEGTRLTVEWIRSGVIGQIREVHLSTNRPIWPQGNLKRPKGIAVPKTLDWDLWLGPAPKKTYHPDVCHFNWRGVWDYGTGAMGDMGAHIFDAPVWALDLGLPVKIQAASSQYTEDYLPLSEMITYEFSAKEGRPAVKVTWFDGGLRPPRPAELENGRRIQDAVYLGSKGAMMHGSHGGAPRIIPEIAMKAFDRPDPSIPRTGDIYEDWIDAIKKGTKASNDFAVAGHLTEIMLLGNIAVLKKDENTILEYDGENGKFTNLPGANDLLHYEYRDGWSL